MAQNKNITDYMPAVVAHTYIRLRGEQQGDITVYHAGTDTARVSLNWGGVLMNFLSARAAQGVLEGLSAARCTLISVPGNIGPAHEDPYDQPMIAVDWQGRPGYAVNARTSVTPDKRRTARWTDVYMGPITFQILDRAAFHSAVEVLRLVHRTAVAVCLDGSAHAADPTEDSYVPPGQ
jgi:hypothetical protein